MLQAWLRQLWPDSLCFNSPGPIRPDQTALHRSLGTDQKQLVKWRGAGSRSPMARYLIMCTPRHMWRIWGTVHFLPAGVCLCRPVCEWASWACGVRLDTGRTRSAPIKPLRSHRCRQAPPPQPARSVWVIGKNRGVRKPPPPANEQEPAGGQWHRR